MTFSTPARPRTRLRVAIGAIAGTAMAVAAPLAASAHVHVDPEDAAAGASTRLDFSFSHGCDDSPTTALVFELPDGLDGAAPVLDGAWTITRELGDDGIPTRIVYSAVTPVDSGISATVSLDVVFSSAQAGSAVAFPVLQQCVTGETDWAQIAGDGEDAHDLDAPAPVVEVGAAAADADAHGHGDAADAADTTAEADPVARWLSAGALAAALAALAIAVFRRRAVR